jgi:streptogrisin C
MRIALLAGALVLAGAPAAHAAPEPSGAPVLVTVTTQTPASVVTPPDNATDDGQRAVRAALRRDLGLDDAAVDARLARDARAAAAEPALRAQLGAAFGGLWVAGDAAGFTVGVTDVALSATIEKAGGRAQPARRSERRLTAARDALDKGSRPPGVHAVFVDLPTNTVVVRADPTALDAARAFVTASGVDGDAVRVEASTAVYRTMYDIRGGDNFGGCSVGFAVLGGFVTAGHCSSVNNPTVGYNGVAAGVTRGSVWPGRDHAFVQTNAAWTPQPLVNNFNGGVVQVAGAQDAPVGAAVCRSGRTTGWHCGTILRRGVSTLVGDASGAVWVYNQVTTTACAEPGDSGGPLLAGNQGQGMLTAGSGNCTSGGETSFQTLREALDAYDLTLVTGAAPPVPLAGDWNGNLVTTVAVYRPASRNFYLRNVHASGAADVTINFGQAGDVPISGDWDGDGTDTIGVYRPGNDTFYLRQTNDPANTATTTYGFSGGDYLPVVGDWNGDGTDNVGLYDPVNHVFHLANEIGATPTWLVSINLGQRGDVPVAGDWDANGVDSIGVFRPTNNTFYRKLNNSATDAGTHTPQAFGQLKDLPLAGDWNGDRRDTVGVFRLADRRFHLYNESGTTTTYAYG